MYTCVYVYIGDISYSLFNTPAKRVAKGQGIQ